MWWFIRPGHSFQKNKQTKEREKKKQASIETITHSFKTATRECLFTSQRVKHLFHCYDKKTIEAVRVGKQVCVFWSATVSIMYLERIYYCPLVDMQHTDCELSSKLSGRKNSWPLNCVACNLSHFLYSSSDPLALCIEVLIIYPHLFWFSL